MSQREYAEDTVFWSLKSAKQFSARRRTMNLFLANATSGTPSSYTWIDNTEKVWSELHNVLEAQNPSSIAVNVHEQIAFSSGLHAGELEMILDRLGSHWKKRLIVEPMLGVEFIATQPKERIHWYRKLQETAWAMISEAFSENVIVPGRTTTEVWLISQTHFFHWLIISGYSMVVT
jgi:hypothetical protein